MKKLRFCFLLVSLLCIISAESNAQWPTTVTSVWASNVVIPLNQNSGTGNFTVSYGPNNGGWQSYLSIGITKGGQPQYFGYLPTYGTFTISSLGQQSIAAEVSWNPYGQPTQYSPVVYAYFFVSKPISSVSISGPSNLLKGHNATYTANVGDGSGSFTYQWYEQNVRPGSGWVSGGTNRTETITMLLWNINVRVDVHDNINGSNGTGYFTIYNGIAKHANPSFSGQAENPSTFALSSYPNPFNPTTTITYQLPEAGYVMLKVFDVMGREVALLQDGVKEAGFYTTTFDASRLTSGIYFSRMTVQPQEGNSIVQTNKLILMK